MPRKGQMMENQRTIYKLTSPKIYSYNNQLLQWYRIFTYVTYNSCKKATYHFNSFAQKKFHENKIQNRTCFSFFLVRWFGKNPIHIRSVLQLLRTLPHREPSGRVEEEYLFIARPNHTPANKQKLRV